MERGAAARGFPAVQQAEAVDCRAAAAVVLVVLVQAAESRQPAGTCGPCSALHGPSPSEDRPFPRAAAVHGLRMG